MSPYTTKKNRFLRDVRVGGVRFVASLNFQKFGQGISFFLEKLASRLFLWFMAIF